MSINFLTDASYNELSKYTILGGGAIISTTPTYINNSSSANYGFGTANGSITGTFVGGTQVKLS